MSTRTFLIRNFRTAPASTTLLARRTIVSSAQQYKTVTETVKEAAKTVDRTVSKAAIKGLEGVEKVNAVAKDAAEKVGIRMEKVDELEVDGKSAAQPKGQQAKRDAKEGIKNTADKFKDVTR